ncbi:MAG: alpha/beta hydrolase [Thiopseudomonas sp.]|nr:alpha/beta hydrolase [Thiopseudomonas sp.]
MTDQALTYLIVPGWNGSPDDHWQSHWQRTLPNARRVQQSNWQQPQRDAWVGRLQAAIEQSAGPVVLVAHSLGCITVAHWAATADARLLQRVQGALLVAPADVERQGCPQELTGFAPVPQQRLPFPSLVLGSSNDPAASAARALDFAGWWGSQARILAGVGHINVASGHNQWEQGFGWLYRLQALAGDAQRLCA